MKPLEPVLVVDLFPEERARLLQLLSHLSEEEWNRPTVCPGWSVKDVVLHLLGDDVGLLSRTPDFKFPTSMGRVEWEELVAFIDHSNKIWVEATRRMSADLLCKFLKFTGEETYQRFLTLDLFALGVPVDWAGPHPAPIWLDLAREYTERWMHHQHIRDAVDKPGLKDRHFFGPVLATFIRALPHTFRNVKADEGTLVHLIISGAAGGEWFLVREADKWRLGREIKSSPDAVAIMDQETAWRLFTKGIDHKEAEEKTRFKGNRSLGLKILDTVSIIA